MSDLRYALRSLAKSRGLAVVIIGSLAIGIGANTIVFSWLQTIVLQPIPAVSRSAQLLTIEPKNAAGAYPGTSWLEYRDLQAQLGAIGSLIAYRSTPLYAGQPGDEQRTYGMLVSANYFSGLALHAAAGRFFRTDETAQPGNAPVAVISHDYWQTQFSSAPDVVGRTLRLNGIPITIIGVAPESFQGTLVGLGYDLWLPATMAPVLLPGSRELESRDQRGYHVLGALRPGATLAQARDEANAAIRRLGEIYPTLNGSMTVDVTPFWRAPRGAQTFIGRALIALQAMMLLVLLLVCANTANLLLARAAARRQEMGVRLAIGASPWRIIRLLLIEGLLLALGGAAFGTLFSFWGVDAFRALPTPGGLPIRLAPVLDTGGLAFAVVLAGACSVFFGLAPALQLARTDVCAALHFGAGGTGGRRSRLASFAVGLEVALALFVLVLAALFLKNLRDQRTGDPGFNTRGVTLAAYDLAGRGYDGPTAQRFTRDLLERLESLPGVEQAAISASVPLDLHGLPSRAVTIPGRPRERSNPDTALTYNVTPGYFATLQIPLVAGTDFTDLNDTTQPPQAIVNQEFVRRYLPDVPPLRRTIVLEGGSFEIAGVVRDSKYESLTEMPQPMMYFSYRERPGLNGQIHLRTRASDVAVAATLRAVLAAVDPRIGVFDVRTLEQHVDKNLFLRRVPARIFSVLGPFALLLAAIGIYAMVAQAVSRRVREIGLRLALGATPAQVISRLVRDSLRPVLFGLGGGWAALWLIVLHLPAGKGPSSGLIFAVLVLLFAVAALACWLPARRATKIDPMIALRAE